MLDKTYVDPLIYYKKRIHTLEVENAELQRKYGEAVRLAASMADASDSMKLQLILSGALTVSRP